MAGLQVKRRETDSVAKQTELGSVFKRCDSNMTLARWRLCIKDHRKRNNYDDASIAPTGSLRMASSLKWRKGLADAKNNDERRRGRGFDRPSWKVGCWA